MLLHDPIKIVALTSKKKWSQQGASGFQSTFLSFIVMPRSAWKGPFFVSFPGLKQAMQNGTPIATQGLFLLVDYSLSFNHAYN